MQVEGLKASSHSRPGAPETGTGQALREAPGKAVSSTAAGPPQGGGSPLGGQQAEGAAWGRSTAAGPPQGGGSPLGGQQAEGAAWGRLSALLGAALLASGLVSWVAANWPHWPVGWRIGLMQALVGGLAFASAVLAWRAGRVPGPWREAGAPALAAALGAVATGALLALVGQVYQTGADTEALFLGWAALTLPWLLGARTVFLAMLTVALLNVGLALWLAGGPLGLGALWRPGEDEALLWYGPVLLNGALLVLVERFPGMLRDPWRVVPRALAALLVGWLFMVALTAEGLGQGPSPLAVPGVALLALLAAWGRRCRDTGLLALAALGGFGLACIWLLARVEGVGSLLAVALALLALAGVLLHGLAKAVAPAGAARPEARSGSWPETRSGAWLLGLFRYVVLVVVALLLLAVLAWWLTMEIAWLPGLGAALIGAGILAWRRTQAAFPRLAASVVAAVGLLLLCAWAALQDGLPLALRLPVVAGAGAVAYACLSATAFRLGTVILTAGTWLVLGWPMGGGLDLLFDDGGPAWRLAALYVRLYGLLGGAGLAWWLASRGRPGWQPLAWGLALLAQCLAWLVPAVGWHQLPALAAGQPLLAASMVAWALLPALLLWRGAAALAPAWRRGAALVMAVAGLGWLGAPGVSLALLWLLLGRMARLPVLTGAGVAALLASLMLYYYRLELPLLDKAVGLALAGGWLLLAAAWAARGLARARGAAEDQAPPPTRRAMAGGRWIWPMVAGGVALVLVNTAIQRHEYILAEGAPVQLALAPVDPRSLLQGDYMTLRFQAAGDIAALVRQAPEAEAAGMARQGSGYAVLQPDPAGGHRPVAVHAEREAAQRVAAGLSPAAPGAAILAFRLRDSREPWLGTDAWFFPEGEGERYAQARHGEFRVLPDGRGRLLRLLDEARRPLP